MVLSCLSIICVYLPVIWLVVLLRHVSSMLYGSVNALVDNVLTMSSYVIEI